MIIALNDNEKFAAKKGTVPDKIDAIKLLRNRLGIGLKEAKDAVEFFCEHEKDYDTISELANLRSESATLKEQNRLLRDEVKHLEIMLDKKDYLLDYLKQLVHSLLTAS